jgi:protein O-mannosyl-transferase
MRRNSQAVPNALDRSAPRVANWHKFLAPVGLAMIILATFGIYWPAMHGRPLLDDNLNLTSPELQSLEGLHRIWTDPASNAQAQYYPLVHTAFWLQHRLWGDAYFGYHLVNVAWHSFAVVLLYLVLTRLAIPGALLAAAIFAVHPVMVESVAWMSEQKNTMSTAFYLGAMIAYLEFDRSRRRSNYLLALALFAMALLTKTVTLSLPLALLVILWWQRGALSWRRDIMPIIPFVVLGLACGLVTVWVEQKYFVSDGMAYELSLLQRILLAGRAIWFYIGKLVWPDVIFIYPRWNIDASDWQQWLFPISAIFATVIFWAIRKRWREPLAAWLLFCGTLFPVLGFLNVHYFVYSFVADHFQYLACLPLIALAAAGVKLLFDRIPKKENWLVAVGCAIVVSALAARTYFESRAYAGPVVLYQTTIDRNPDCWLAHSNLGLALLEHDPQAAIEHFREGLRLRPDYVGARQNLANALMATGRLNKAISEMRIVASHQPDNPTVLNTLGAALLQAGEYTEASQQFQRALQLRPDDPMTHYNLGVLQTYAGNTAEAIAQYEQAIRLSPKYTHAHNSLAVMLEQAGRRDEALEHLQTALRLDPKFLPAYANIVRELALANRPHDAIAAAEKGIEVARAAGNQSAAEQISDWLNHYKVELRRAHDAAPAANPSLPAHELNTP